MPVIECCCGMVMSTSTAKARSSCIRCGGIEFQIIPSLKTARLEALEPPRDTQWRNVSSQRPSVMLARHISPSAGPVVDSAVTGG